MHHSWEELSQGVRRCRLPFLDVSVGLVWGRHGVVLIDCGTTLIEAAALAEDVVALTGRPVTHIVLTHHHFDHILGAGGFADAAIYAAPPVAIALTTGLGATREHALRYGARSADLDSATAAARTPGHLGMDADIDLGERTVAVRHLGGGHTDHDLVAVIAGSGGNQPAVVFCGDLVEESADPAIDAGSRLDAWPATLDRLIDVGGPDALYVPGHGAVVDASFVHAQRDWLTARSPQ